MPILVFVYGTLRKGEPNCERFLQGAARLGDAVSVEANYQLYGSGIPYLRQDRKEAGHAIKGEVWAVTEEQLLRLDRLEGHPRYYKREPRLFQLADGSQVEAWVYLVVSIPSKRDRLKPKGQLLEANRLDMPSNREDD
jgi:gamma-glutamylaminecyclotransferase